MGPGSYTPAGMAGGAAGGALGDEVLDEPEDSPAVSAAHPSGAAGAGSVHGVVPNPAQRSRSSAYERRRGDRASAGGYTVLPPSTLVLVGRPGELAERLVEAMLHSRARVESVRRVWIAADGVPGGWDLRALDPLVLERLRAPDRTPRR